MLSWARIYSMPASPRLTSPSRSAPPSKTSSQCSPTPRSSFWGAPEPGRSVISDATATPLFGVQTVFRLQMPLQLLLHPSVCSLHLPPCSAADDVCGVPHLGPVGDRLQGPSHGRGGADDRLRHCVSDTQGAGLKGLQEAAGGLREAWV